MVLDSRRLFKDMSNGDFAKSGKGGGQGGRRGEKNVPKPGLKRQSLKVKTGPLTVLKVKRGKAGGKRACPAGDLKTFCVS